MKKLIFLVFLLGAMPTFAQKDSLKKKKTIFLMWGYNREAYTTSTLHFVNHGSGTGVNGSYDFKVHDVKAHDRPDFDQLYDVINITIPQFNVRVGFWLNNSNNEGFELSYDHAKYVVTNYQTARFEGNIDGQYVNKDSLLDPNFFHFEHTDGANFWMISYLKKNKIYYSKNKNVQLSYIFKPGAGAVIPRTDVTIFGDRLNNNFKVAGFCAAIETAIRLELYKHFILDIAAKGGYANYMNAFVHNKGHGKVSHQFGFLEGIFTFGYQFGKKQKQHESNTKNRI